MAVAGGVPHDDEVPQPAFLVSAPGKVIVYGEHAVVHGKVRQASPPKVDSEAESCM